MSAISDHTHALPNPQVNLSPVVRYELKQFLHRFQHIHLIAYLLFFAVMAIVSLLGSVMSHVTSAYGVILIGGSWLLYILMFSMLFSSTFMSWMNAPTEYPVLPEEVPVIPFSAPPEQIARSRQHPIQIYPSMALPSSVTGRWVYILQDVEVTGYFKIGRTNDLFRRTQRFEVSLPFEARLIHYIACTDEHEIEAALHHYFSHKRIRGEWFSLNHSDVQWLLAIDKA